MNSSAVFGAVIGFLYSMLCLGLGVRALSAFGLRLNGDDWHLLAAKISASFALGQAILGTIWLICALSGQFNERVILGLSLIFLIVVLTSLWKLIADARRVVSAWSAWVRRLRTCELALFVALLISCFLLLIRAFYPPTVDDTLMVYFLTPKVIAETSILSFQPFNRYVLYPLLSEMNYAFVMAVGNETSATIFDTLVAFNVLLIIFALSGYVGLPSSGALVAVLALLASPAFLALVGSGKVEITGTQYGLLAALFAIRSPHRNVVDYGVSGLFLGSALAVKYSMVILLPGIAFLFVSSWRCKRDSSALSRKLLYASTGVLAIAVFLIPQLIKNLILVENPTAPFLSSFFGTDGTFWALRFASEYSGFDNISLLDLLMHPLTLTFASRRDMLGNISPLFLAFLPAMCWLGFSSQREKRLAIAGSIMIGTWLLIRPLTLFTRVLFPSLALLAVPAGGTAQRLMRVPVVRVTVTVCLILVSLFMLFELRSAAYAGSYLLGIDNRSDIYERHHARDFYAVATYLNREVAKDERVFLEDMRYLYFLRTDILTRSETSSEIELASQGCGQLSDVLRTGSFRWLVGHSTISSCPIPSGFSTVFSSGPMSVYESTNEW